MDTNGRKWVENDLVYQISGCAMAVMNELGHGLREKTYERALCVEFKFQNMAYDHQHVHPVKYRGENVGQVINCYRITGHKAGVILNFKHSKLEWKKVVLTEANT